MVICPYCNKEAELVSGAVIYPKVKKARNRYYYSCADCAAHVGCHKGTKKALGTLAKAELRKARLQAHIAFDTLWKTGKMTRRQAYRILANRLKKKVKDCHIGIFDIETCAKVVLFSKLFETE